MSLEKDLIENSTKVISSSPLKEIEGVIFQESSFLASFGLSEEKVTDSLLTRNLKRRIKGKEELILESLKSGYLKGSTFRHSSLSKPLIREELLKRGIDLKKYPVCREYFTTEAFVDRFIEFHSGKLAVQGGKLYTLNEDTVMWEKKYSFATLINLIGEFKDIDSDRIRKDLSYHVSSTMEDRILAFSSARKIESVKSLIAARITVEEDIFNHRDKDAVLLDNGVYNFATKSLEAPLPSDYWTKKLAGEYRPGETTETVDSFFKSVADNELKFFEYVLGSTVLSRPGKVAAALLGDSDNGKTVMVEALSRFMGDYFIKVPRKLLTSGLLDDNLIYALKGKKIAVIEELPEKGKINTALIKDLVATDSMSARPNYESLINFPNTVTVLITTNELTDLDLSKGANSESIAKRLRVITFDKKYTFSPDPKNKRELLADDRILEKIFSNKRNRNAFATRLIDCAQKVYDEPFYYKDPSVEVDSIKDNTRLWINKDEAQPLLKDLLTVTNSAKDVILLEDLRQALLEKGRVFKSNNALFVWLDNSRYIHSLPIELKSHRSPIRKNSHIHSYSDTDNKDLIGQKIAHITGVKYAF